MAKNTFNSIATLLAATALVTPWGVPAWAQTTEPDAGGPDLQHRCTMVALTSDTPMLPVQLIEPYLQERDDFRSSRLVLTGDANAADASVTLTRNGETTTRIAVANRATGQYVSAISGWTDYPGMVALAIMDQLRQVCPGSIVALPKYRAAPKQCVPAPALRSLSTVSACSLTSWMDNRELYNALRANAELKQASIQLLPACSSADATLEITHNLDRTLEWSWRLVSSQHQTVSSGNVIAFAVGNAAERISDRVAREIALARGDSVEPAGNTRQRAQEDISIRNIRSHLLFSDLSQHDSRISLSVDGERVSGRDASNRVAFSFPMEALLDAQLRKEWNHPLQIEAPNGLVGMLYTATSVQEGEAIVGALSIYATIAALAAQVRTPVHILDLAWQEDGALKTVSLQVPVHESGRLWHVLRRAGSGELEQACSSPTVVSTSQK